MRKVLFLFVMFLMMMPDGYSRRRERRPVVRLETTMGTIRIALRDDTPVHRDNFLKLAEEGYYDGTLFHRVIEDFMIQGGDPESKEAPRNKKLGEGGPGYTLPAEINWPYCYHLRGMVAMARKPDSVNPERRSSGSQFYIVWGQSLTPPKIMEMQATLDEMTGGSVKINYEQMCAYEQYGGAPHLDGQYTIFGEVIEGLSVVKKIQKTATDSNNRPLKDVVVLRAVVEQKGKK